MKCFYIFKGKSKSKKGQANSAPELRDQSKSNTSSPSRTAKSLPSPRSVPELYKEKEHNLRVFSFQELREATNGFNRLLKIGEGGFGSVYKGTVRPASGQRDPIVVAIKKLNNHGLQINNVGSDEFDVVSHLVIASCIGYKGDSIVKHSDLGIFYLGHKQWLAEVQFLGIVSHPNLVKLLGYCSLDNERGIQRLLVYEYMPNRSLEDHLFKRGLPTLSWRKRLEIMLGAGEGLAYLHGGMEVQVVGTYGYAAPEYVETGHLTIHSDIWSFGVVLYEILTGRRTLERNRPVVEQKLLDWVKQFPVDSKRFSMIIDPRLINEYSFSAAKQIAKLADSCLKKNARERPTMTQVVESLKQIIQDLGDNSSTNRNAESSQSSFFRRNQNKVCPYVLS
ncbi:hypothetical protein SADUNF_Sadunf01G0123000 [Salix dunnii]|uniref:Protein kinase domain-containing protein n=1 Tax=Salix dunnii TaxID=1413687 RepID=A0A835TNA7_9ROSI|nr:hypothetical protein SADUNF_Sadunf01G0123000 [Salix dunnii]